MNKSVLRYTKAIVSGVATGIIVSVAIYRGDSVADALTQAETLVSILGTVFVYLFPNRGTTAIIR